MYVNKRFKPTDKIEFGLQARFRRDGYYIVYRFLPKKIRIRILWFYVNITIKDTWTVICLYNTDNNPLNVIDKDYVSGSYNLDELNRYMNGFSIKLKNNIIGDFIDYAHIKCSSVDSYSNKFNKDYSVKFLEENRFINDVNNGRRK